MPSLQQFMPDEMRCLSGNGTDILQKHSINSILEQRKDILTEATESTEEFLSSPLVDSIGLNDILGLSKPNTNNMVHGGNSNTNTKNPLGDGLNSVLGGGPSASTGAVSIAGGTGLSFPPLTPNSTQSSVSPDTLTKTNNFNLFQFDNVTQTTQNKVFQKNISFDCSAPLSPSTPSSLYNRSFHSSPLVSDSSNSSNPTFNFDSSRASSPENNNNNNIPYNINNNNNNNISNKANNNTNHLNCNVSLIDMMNLLSVNMEKNTPENSPQPNYVKNNPQNLFPPQQQQQSMQTSLNPIKYSTLSNLAASSSLFEDFDSKNSSETFPSTMDTELTRLQNLQALNALRLLQTQSSQQIPWWNEMFQSNNNHTNQMQVTKGWQLPPQLAGGNDAQLDRIAKFYRSSAALYNAKSIWNGKLPVRSHRIFNYSPKVFFGGIPWDISENSLIQILKPFGQVKVDWPKKEQGAPMPKGFAFIIFESDKQVKALLSACSTKPDELHNTNTYFYKMSSRRIKGKDVEVTPWIIADSNYVKSSNQKLDPMKTVFVGALHGKLTAEGLATIMDDLFDGVLYAGIDTDKYKYPIGSGRVTFNNYHSYMRAISTAFLEIQSAKFTKKVQIDPYLEDALCSMCGVQHGPYYCRELTCFRYFCKTCWQWQHTHRDFKNHNPLTRNSKSQVLVGFGTGSTSTTSLSSFSGNSNHPNALCNSEDTLQQEPQQSSISKNISLYQNTDWHQYQNQNQLQNQNSNQNQNQNQFQFQSQSQSQSQQQLQSFKLNSPGPQQNQVEGQQNYQNFFQNQQQMYRQYQYQNLQQTI